MRGFLTVGSERTIGRGSYFFREGIPFNNWHKWKHSPNSKYLGRATYRFCKLLIDTGYFDLKYCIAPNVITTADAIPSIKIAKKTCIPVVALKPKVVTSRICCINASSK